MKKYIVFLLCLCFCFSCLFAQTKPKAHSAKKASYLSAFLPGAGQVYNKQAWKIPIIYASAGAVTDFADYSADNIAIIDNNIYFSNGSINNALCSFDITNKTYTKLNNDSIHNLIAVNTDLFYMNKNDENKIYKYDTINSSIILICPDNVGSFILNGDFIIYQNFSDHSKLYSIKTDGTSKQKLTDYPANSFVVFESQLLFFNSKFI